jgi:hypothetical protein
MLENTEGAIKNGQSRETGTQDEENQNKNTTHYVGYYYMQRNTNTFTNKTDRHDIAEILLKVALSIIILTLQITSDISLP